MKDTTVTAHRSYTAAKACLRPAQGDDVPSTKDCGRSKVKHIARGDSRDQKLSVPTVLPGASLSAGHPVAPGTLTEHSCTPKLPKLQDLHGRRWTGNRLRRGHHHCRNRSRTDPTNMVTDHDHNNSAVAPLVESQRDVEISRDSFRGNAQLKRLVTFGHVPQEEQRSLQRQTKQSVARDREQQIRNLCEQEMERSFPKIVPMPQLHCMNKALKKDFKNLGKVCITTFPPSRKKRNKRKTVETVDKMFYMSTINRAIFMRQLGILPEEDVQYLMGHTNVGDRISDCPCYISRAVTRHISGSTLSPTPRQTTGVRGQPKTGRGTSAWPLPNEPTLLFLQPDLTIRPGKKCRQPVPRDLHTKLQRPNWNTNRPLPPILSDTVCQEPTLSAVRAPTVEDAGTMADIAKAACSRHNSV